MIYHFSNRISGCLLTAVALLQLVPSTASAAVVAGKPFRNTADDANRHDNTVVVPFDDERYGELSGRFWKWEFSLPVSNHPLSINSGMVDCTAGQSGSVWFLGGTFTATPFDGYVLGQADRTCTIPSGKSLFFPIVNAECSTIQGDCFSYDPAHPPKESDLRRAAMSIANSINPHTLSVTIDNLNLTGRAVYKYRVQSDQFLIGPLPNNNIFQFFGLTAPAGTTARSVSDGIHLLLYPLSPGAHTIHFEGEFDNPDGSKSFVEKITYHLTATH